MPLGLNLQMTNTQYQGESFFLLEFPLLRQVLISRCCNSHCLRFIQVSPYGNSAGYFPCRYKKVSIKIIWVLNTIILTILINIYLYCKNFKILTILQNILIMLQCLKTIRRRKMRKKFTPPLQTKGFYS